MSIEELNELLSLETAPAGSLAVEQRQALAEAFEGAEDEAALAALAGCAQQALEAFGDNLRGRYAVALHQELSGETEEAGKAYHHLARELEKQEDWGGARELAARALPLRPDYRVVRLLLGAWAQLPDKTAMEDDLALAQSWCPESPDLLWFESKRADAEGDRAEAEALACEALNEFVLTKEPERAEEPLLRILESEAPGPYRALLRIMPRMAKLGLGELLDTTLELSDEAFGKLKLKGELAAVLERILLKRKGFEGVRPAYVKALVASLGGGRGVEAFVADCGLSNADTPLEQALERFHEMYDLRPGAFVEHHNFGVGRITAHDDQFLVIDFADKPGHRMALEIAGRSLRPLPDGCLRVARFSEPDTIAYEIASEPVGLLLRALADLGGAASARELRDCLAGSTIPDDDWSSWWKRAREAAQKDPRVDTSQAFRQVYRIPTGEDEEEIELPPLPGKGGAQSAATMIERLLKQHPELEERVQAEYAEALAERAVSAPAGGGVPAVPLLMRWLPERVADWTRIAELAFRREPGVAGGITAEQQGELLELGLAGGAWREAAVSALPSRFPLIREKGLATLRERLGAEFLPVIRDVVLGRDARLNAKLAIIRLGLGGGLGDGALTPWELLIGTLSVISSNPPVKLQHAALDLLDPQEKLAARLRGASLEGEVAERLIRAARDLAGSEAGLVPLVLLLAASGFDEIVERLKREQAAEVTDPVAIHFDPGVTLMSRVTYEQNLEKITDLQHQLATTIPREIGAARALGDLSENAEYHAARERQGIADATMRSLKSQMQNAREIDDLHFPPDTVTAGTEVVIRDLADNHERTLWLLGHGDSVQDKHAINYRAPLGQALVGKVPGDIVEFDGGGAVQRLEVVSVKRRLP